MKCPSHPETSSLFDLAFALDAINAGSIPPVEGDEDSEWAHRRRQLPQHPARRHPRILQKNPRHLPPLLIRCSNCGERHITAPRQPRSRIFAKKRVINLEADTLETHPSIDKAGDTARWIG
ncbi:hypothetical protein J4530_08655 [Neisseria subflava]|uniref:hypothetical protein n=1 Tax=Neisseria subflava TaxID=28449 RepID=UPI00202A5D1D|nr:hypothetical protein [Neisseria subflava]MCL9788226.1 hypothetical protein [Neisseria subflava]